MESRKRKPLCWPAGFHIWYWDNRALNDFKGVKNEKFDGNNNETFDNFTAAQWDNLAKKLNQLMVDWERP